MKLVLSVIGFYCVRHLLFFRIAFALYVLLLFMTTKWSLPLWQTIPFLQYTQFLGRLFTAVYPLQYLFIIQCVHGKAHMPRHMYAYGIKCVALLLALGVVALYNPFSITERLGGEKDLRDIMGKTRLTRPPVDYEAKKAELEKKRFLTFAAHNEFFPRTASKEGLINRLHHSLPMVEMWDVLNSTMRIAMEDNPQAPHVIKASVHANGGPYPWLIINQFDFPGWVVKVDGHAVGYADTAEELNQVVRDLDANGRIIVKFPTAGDYQLEAYYEGPPDWRLRNGAILAICVGFFAFFGVAYRRYRQNCLAQGT